MLHSLSRSILFAVSWAVFCFHVAQASETGKLAVELNGLSQVNSGCQMTFVTQNNLDVEVADLALEVVLFDKSAKVIKFLKLGAGALPKSKTRVKRFTIAKTDCASIARVLINDVARCKADEMTRPKCLGLLALTNKSGVEFGL